MRQAGWEKLGGTAGELELERQLELSLSSGTLEVTNLVLEGGNAKARQETGERRQEETERGENKRLDWIGTYCDVEYVRYVLCRSMSC